MVIANVLNIYTTVAGLWQYDYGQILRLQGIKLPTAVEIHFSLQEKGGESVTRIGTTKDGVTDVAIPDSMLENDATTMDYKIYAFVYLADSESGRTEYKVSMSVKSRPKPESFEKPEDAELFRQAITEVNNSAEVALQSKKEAEAWAHGHAEYADRDQDNAKYYAKQAKDEAEKIQGKVKEGKEEIDRYIKENRDDLKGEIGNVNFAAFKVVAGRLKMYSDPNVDKVRFYRVGSKLKLNLYDLYLKDFFLVMNKDIKKITTNDIRVYLYKVQQQRKLSNRTLDSRRSAIHAFLEWATNEEYIDRNPCRNIKRIKYERKKKKPLTPLEMEQLRNACETVRDKALVEFFYSTGCRVTECERMNLDDVDFLKKEVHLFGKGDKHRTSFLNAKAELALKNYLETRNLDDPALFVGERKPYNRLKKAAIEKRFRQLGEKAGIKRRVHPHLIRHTSATDARDHGMPIEEVKEFLGHSSIATTLEYADVTEATTKCSHKRCVI